MAIAVVENNRGLLSRFCQMIRAGDLDTVLKQLRTPEDQERFAEEGLAWMAKNAPAPAPVAAAPVVAPAASVASVASESGELDQVRAELGDVRAELGDVRARLNIANNRADALQRWGAQVGQEGQRQLNIANNRADALQRQVEDLSSRQELQSIRLSTLAQDVETLRNQVQQPPQAAAPTEQPSAAPTEQPSAAPTEQPAPVTVIFGGGSDNKPKRSAKDT